MARRRWYTSEAHTGDLPEGWIRHDGAGCPVPPDSAPGVMFRYGATAQLGGALATHWTSGNDGRSWWDWDGDSHDIVAYCPHPEIVGLPPIHSPMSRYVESAVPAPQIEHLDPAAIDAHLEGMCNRYKPGERETIRSHFNARALRAFNDGPAIVHPREPGWVIRMVDGFPVLDQMTWGFPVYVRGRTGQRGQPLKPKPVNNARFDKLGAFWRKWASVPLNRCLIPASGYAEAVGEPGAMTTTWLSLKSTPVFAWAGLWAESDEWGPVYTGVMTSNCAELAHIHDRSPVIIPPDKWETWLGDHLGGLRQFDRPWPAEDMEITETPVLWKDGGR